MGPLRPQAPACSSRNSRGILFPLLLVPYTQPLSRPSSPDLNKELGRGGEGAVAPGACMCSRDSVWGGVCTVPWLWGGEPWESVCVCVLVSGVCGCSVKACVCKCEQWGLLVLECVVWSSACVCAPACVHGCDRCAWVRRLVSGGPCVHAGWVCPPESRHGLGSAARPGRALGSPRFMF